MTNLDNLFNSILNFYKQFQFDTKIEPIYFNTLKILYLSFKQYLLFRNASTLEIINHI